MTLKRVFAVFLCVFTLLPLLTISAEAEAVRFNDVKETDWSFDGIMFMCERGFMAGTGENTFSPTVPMTRAMFVTVLASMAGVQTDNSEKSKFDDVPADLYFTGAVNWASENGIVAGIDDATFGANNSITREQTAVMLRRFGEYLDYDVTYEDETLLSLCSDTRKIGNYAVNAVQWALDYGLMSNCGDMKFSPKKELTRAEAALILSKFTMYEETPPIVPPTVHKVKFVNWDGSALYESIVADGTAAKYRGNTPKKPEDIYYTYKFDGWNVELENIKDDTTFKAVFVTVEKPKPDYSAIDIRKDIFGPGMTVNNSSFRMSTGLNQRIQAALRASGGRAVGFYLIDPETRMTLGYNANLAFNTASTVKAGMALYAFKQIEAGRVSFNNIWVYQRKHYCPPSGTICNSAFGTKYSVQYVLHNMINISDNVAYYMTQDYLGYKGYNALVSSLGVKHLHSSFTSWGYLTPQELGLIWQEIYRYKDQSSMGAKLFNEFLNAQFNFVKQGLDYKYKSAHKSGFNADTYGDAAVVFAERPYIVVILLAPGNKGGNQAYLGKIAKLLDEYMKEYNTWLKTHK